MTRKKVYRLKPAVKVFLVIIVFCSLFIPVAWNKYQEYLYTKTNEYANIICALWKIMLI